MFWRQRSRKVFFKEGDQNTKYFHMTTLKHRMANRISRLKMEERFTENDESINREAVEFFSNLLQGDPNLDLEKKNFFLDCIPFCIFEDQNNSLTSIPSSDEISKDVFSFDIDKSPGPDGFPFFFFQQYWKIIGTDVCNGVKEFFGSRNILKEVNVTFISLILKKLAVDSLDQFRPICLCNYF